jgi:hypothetical protein
MNEKIDTREEAEAKMIKCLYVDNINNRDYFTFERESNRLIIVNRNGDILEEFPFVTEDLHGTN